MSYEHGTYGWGRYENFIKGVKTTGLSVEETLKDENYIRGQEVQCLCYCNSQESCPCCKGTCDHKQNLRLARFTTAEGKQMIVEEYLQIKDLDCDGSSWINIAVYEQGQRPDLKTEIREA